MTPGARAAAAIEVLDQVAASRAPADEVLRSWGRAHRFAGSKDRRAIAELAFAGVRARALAGWRFGGDDGRACLLQALGEAGRAACFTGEAHAPAPLTDAERAALARPDADAPDWARAGVPAWKAPLLEASFGADWAEEAAALSQGRAPIDLRVNLRRAALTSAQAALAAADLASGATPLSATGLRLTARLAPDLHKLQAFRAGWFEVQDEGSQLMAWLAGAEPGMTVVDYCAGGGGKTLALWQAMGAKGSGRLIAFDVDPRRLDAIRPRLERSGAQATLRAIGADGQGTQDLEGRADLVLVDAPCSASGTWRRRPEAIWRTTPESLQRLTALQSALLDRASRLVRPGGRLAYVTCSVFAAENLAAADAFVAAHADFRPRSIADAAGTSPLITPQGRDRLAELARGGHSVQLSPRRTDTDGFFAALFERSPA